jgi:hypothetical protein
MLQAWREEDGIQAEELFPLLYNELRKQAHSFLAERQVIAADNRLINETYIKLREQRHFEWEAVITSLPFARC